MTSDRTVAGALLAPRRRRLGCRDTVVCRARRVWPRASRRASFSSCPSPPRLIVPPSSAARDLPSLTRANMSARRVTRPRGTSSPAWLCLETRLPVGLAFSPRADLLVLNQPGTVRSAVVDVENEHPELSWSTLWGEGLVRGLPGARTHSWQSSAAETAFEPKFSLSPLLFGTLKSAFYAMLFATPLAIMGAVYTAYFMAPSMRRLVKPGIEIMAALPTVVLGFMAGLWLAPIIEANLASTLSLLIILPDRHAAHGMALVPTTGDPDPPVRRVGMDCWRWYRSWRWSPSPSSRITSSKMRCSAATPSSGSSSISGSVMTNETRWLLDWPWALR